MHEDARNPPQHNFVKGEVYSLIFCQMRSFLGAFSCLLLLFTKLFDTVTDCKFLIHGSRFLFHASRGVMTSLGRELCIRLEVDET